MLIIGLTGGIGSGKSTVASLFSELGTPIIDTDQLAREAVLPGSEALEKIIVHFGEHLLLANSTLNRKALQEIIFTNQQHRLWLESLLHPIIRQLLQQRIASLDAPYCIVQIPLLVGQAKNPLIQRVLVIESTPTLQQQRIKQRDQLSDEIINAMFDAQATPENLRNAADDIIINNGSLETLKQQVFLLHNKYIKCSNVSVGI